MAETNTPYPLAMIICDFIWRDPFNGKATIIGTFSSIAATQFPAVHPIISVFLALTDGRGKTKIKLCLVDVDEQHEPIFQGENEVDFIDPRAIIESVMVIP